MREGLFDGVDDEKKIAGLRLEYAFGDAVVEEVEQLVIEAIDVEEKGWLLVQVQVLPGENLEHLLERAEAARKDEEGIGQLGHLGFARVHGGGDVQLGEAAVCDLELDEAFGDDSNDAAAAGKTGFGDGSHQTDVGSAVDDTDALFGESATEGDGSFKIEGIGAVG